MPLQEDAEGAWISMSDEGKVAAFTWFTDDPVAEAPLKHIITVSDFKNHLRLVSKLFKSHAEEGATTLPWDGRRRAPPTSKAATAPHPMSSTLSSN